MCASGTSARRRVERRWTPTEARGVTASGLVLAFEGGTDPGQHPDFSATGAPITFGFLSRQLDVTQRQRLHDHRTDRRLDRAGEPTPARPESPTASILVVAGPGRATPARARRRRSGATTGTRARTTGAAPAPASHPAVVCDDGDPCDRRDACPKGARRLRCRATTAESPARSTCAQGNVRPRHRLHRRRGHDRRAPRSCKRRRATPTASPRPRGESSGRRWRRHASKLAAADEATKARASRRKLLGRADHLVDVAKTLVAKAQSHDLITAECAAVVVGFLDDLAMCVDELPHG